ncbi:MAG: hypothetical protein KUG77_09410 [Nannocystaceae bacterium]|nr:hypothetical protein [Nannocystaceae bacterium]
MDPSPALLASADESPLDGTAPEGMPTDSSELEPLPAADSNALLEESELQAKAVAAKPKSALRDLFPHLIQGEVRPRRAKVPAQSVCFPTGRQARLRGIFRTRYPCPMQWRWSLMLGACVVATGCAADDAASQEADGSGSTSAAATGITQADDSGGSEPTSAGGTSGGSVATMTPTTGEATSEGPEMGSGEDSTGGPPEPMFTEHYMGRFEFSGEGDPRASWSGSTARTRIDGTSLSIGLDGPSGIHFQAVVDGEPTAVFVTQSGAQSYVVASGLAPGEHDIEVVRRNEGYFGIVGYTGFELGSGTTFVDTPWPYGLHVEFIGDSLTAGYGVECSSGDENFSAPTQSAYASYAMVAARELEASAHLIAYSGKGAYQNYGGNLDEPMPELWPRLFTTQAEPLWDAFAQPADVVVVNLGTNDFSAAIAYDDFVGAYLALLEDVRTRYPSATIIGISWAHWGSQSESWVTDAVEQFGDANSTTERFVIDAEDGWGCDYHTNVVSNQKLGEQLAARISGL